MEEREVPPEWMQDIKCQRRTSTRDPKARRSLSGVKGGFAETQWEESWEGCEEVCLERARLWQRPRDTKSTMFRGLQVCRLVGLKLEVEELQKIQ